MLLLGYNYLLEIEIPALRKAITLPTWSWWVYVYCFCKNKSLRITKIISCNKLTLYNAVHSAYMLSIYCNMQSGERQPANCAIRIRPEILIFPWNLYCFKFYELEQVPKISLVYLCTLKLEISGLCLIGKLRLV